MNIYKARLMLLFLGSFAIEIALGQQASQSTVNEPDIAPRVQALSGQLVYHDGIREWFEPASWSQACERVDGPA